MNINTIAQLEEMLLAIENMIDKDPLPITFEIKEKLLNEINQKKEEKMKIHELANFPEIRLEQNQGMHCLFLNNNASMCERSELEAMANGANMLKQIICQYLDDLDHQVQE